MTVINHDFNNHSQRHYALLVCSGMAESILAMLDHHGLKDGYSPYKDIETALKVIRDDCKAAQELMPDGGKNKYRIEK